MTNYIEKKVTYKQIDEGSIGQKVDNFLIKILKGVPKSHIYKYDSLEHPLVFLLKNYLLFDQYFPHQSACR